MSEEAGRPARRDLARGLRDEVAVHTLGRGPQDHVHSVVGHILIGVSRRRLKFVKPSIGLLRSQLHVEGRKRGLRAVLIGALVVRLFARRRRLQVRVLLPEGIAEGGWRLQVLASILGALEPIIEGVRRGHRAGVDGRAGFRRCMRRLVAVGSHLLQEGGLGLRGLIVHSVLCGVG